MNLVRNFLGSIAVKFSAALLVMMGLIAAVIVASQLAMTEIESRVDQMVAQDVEALRQASEVGITTSQLKDALAQLLLAKKSSDLQRARETAAAAVGQMETAIERLGEAHAEQFRSHVGSVETALADLAQARQVEFFSVESASRSVGEIQAVRNALNLKLVELVDEAAFDLTIGSENVTATLDETLSGLVNEEFEQLKSLLLVRSEINLLSGLTLALAQSGDAALRSILHDLKTGATSRLEDSIAEFERLGFDEGLIEQAQTASNWYSSVSERGLSSARALAVRREIDRALSDAVDDVVFNLMIRSEDASAGNAEIISGLINNELAQIRQLDELRDAVSEFALSALDGAVAGNKDQLRIATARLETASKTLQSKSADLPTDVEPGVTELLSFADAATGIVSWRGAALDAQAKASEIAYLASESVGKIAQSAEKLGAHTTAQIAEQGSLVSDDISASQTRMQGIVLISFGSAFVVLGGLVFTVVLPLRRLTRATEKLAGGDLGQIKGLGKRAGEIGRMAAALEVFRQNLIRNSELVEEERMREAEAREVEKRLQNERQEREETARQQKKEAEKAERAREAAEAAERESIRRAAEAERKARADEQAKVVELLALALDDLSAGKLNSRIDQAFPGDYDRLRVNFNETIKSLEDTLRSVAKSSETIGLNAREIKFASEDLSKRTELTAGTLEETSSSLSDLTGAVKSTADNAAQVAQIVGKAQGEANENGRVVEEAIEAMNEIEASSDEISKIVGLIDNIAFQTNLLALNAGVEAARAGESGRGFAVVASEVRSLAQRSADAAKDISELISSSRSQVERGAMLVGKSGDAMRGINNSVSKIANFVSEIAEAAGEQSAGLLEINNAVVSLDSATQQNAARSEETTAASFSLDGEVTELTRLIKRFEIDERSSKVPERDQVSTARLGQAKEA